MKPVRKHVKPILEQTCDKATLNVGDQSAPLWAEAASTALLPSCFCASLGTLCLRHCTRLQPNSF